MDVEVGKLDLKRKPDDYLFNIKTSLRDSGILLNQSIVYFAGKDFIHLDKRYKYIDISSASAIEIHNLAKCGSIPDQIRLAQLLFDGIFFQRDYEHSAYWFKSAADKNDPVALDQLGLMTLNGLGIPSNAELALDLFIKSAQLNYHRALIHIAEFYYNRFLQRDYKCEDYFEFLHSGDDLQRDYKSLHLAIQWYENAQTVGISLDDTQVQCACFDLATAYQHGIYVTKDSEKSIFYYNQANIYGHGLAGEQIKTVGEKDYFQVTDKNIIKYIFRTFCLDFENIFNLQQVCKLFKICTIQADDKFPDYEDVKLVFIFPNITELYINGNDNCESIKNWMITGLTSLKILGLVDIDDITDDGLKLLTNLTDLNLCGNNKITDVSVEKLTNLTRLDLCNNDIITNYSLNKLPKLTNLDLTNNDVITDEILGSLTDLKSLNLFGNETITDRALMNLTNLTNLVLEENDTITDASLEILTNLVKLNVNNNTTITNVSLLKLPNLRKLKQYQSNIQDLMCGQLSCQKNDLV